MGPLIGILPGISNFWNQKMNFVLETIRSDKVVIFSKTHCPYCGMAKDVFHQLKQPYTAVELDKRPDGSKIQDILKSMTGARSVPRIFVDGKFVGGASDVKEMYDNGHLRKLLMLPNCDC